MYQSEIRRFYRPELSILTAGAERPHTAFGACGITGRGAYRVHTASITNNLFTMSVFARSVLTSADARLLHRWSIPTFRLASDTGDNGSIENIHPS